jgi:hypothetical protein
MADITFESTQTYQFSEGLSKGIVAVVSKTFYLKDNMLRVETRANPPGIAPPQIRIYDASKRSIVFIVPKYRAYAAEAWSVEMLPLPQVLVHQDGPDITENNETKSLSGWTARSRTIRDPACNSHQEWVSSEPEILRNLITFEQTFLKAEAGTGTHSSQMGKDTDIGRVFLLESKKVCGKDSPNKFLQGVTEEIKNVDIHLDAVDPALFAPPPDYEEFPFEKLAKAVHENKAPKKIVPSYLHQID